MHTERMATSGENRAELSLLPTRLGLPRGRSALPEPEVADSRRGRILQAVTDEIAERGYAATSVAHITAGARVSRSAFYAMFTDKQDAFAQAHLAASEQLFDLIQRALEGEAASPLPVRHRAAITAYLDGFCSAPTYATSFMVEIRSAGARLLDQRDVMLERHARAVRALAREAHIDRPDRPLPSWAAIVGVVGGSDELATRVIRAGRFEDLPALVEPILELQQGLIAPT